MNHNLAACRYYETKDIIIYAYDANKFRDEMTKDSYS